MERKSQSSPIIIVIITLVLLGLACLCAAVFTGGALFGSLMDNPATSQVSTPNFAASQTPLAQVFTTTESSLSLEQANQTLQTLNDTIVPSNDPAELANRLLNKKDVPTVLIDHGQPYALGAQKNFWVSNVDTNRSFQVKATLRYVGQNVYFWIEDGIDYQESDLTRLADTMDQEIIPTDRSFFGMEWNPGVDGDPRMYVLYARGLGESIAGYFSSIDELTPEAHPYSNAHEMFLMNADSVDLGENYIYGTMAHEFQHMIHWYQDRNEDTWLNEGFSMLAEQVNGYDSGGFDYQYMLNPDLQLNDWGAGSADNTAHYGASLLFTVYFYDRFGEQATKAIIAEKENGFASIEKVMQDLNLTNPDTNLPYTANEFFSDWAVANYLQNTGIQNGRYDYRSYAPYAMSNTRVFTTCPDDLTADLFQFGVAYYQIDCPGKHTLNFQGLQTVKLMPFAAPASGSYFYWSNNGDESDPALWRAFDLSQAKAPISLKFKTWYDLEKDYDYVFLSASTDGETWQILSSNTCTTENPSGNSYGCGWNGESGGWIDESVDLSAFAGENVTLRFDYVTDAAVNGKGFSLDDFSIDAINYHSNLELDAGGWQANGFVRIENILPQTYTLRLISIGRTTSVESVPLDPFNKAQVSFEIGSGINRVVLVVSGTTPETRERAAYQLKIQ